MSIVEAEQQTAPVSVSLSVGGKAITFETGKLAKQADGAVVVRSGGRAPGRAVTKPDCYPSERPRPGRLRPSLRGVLGRR